MEMGLTQADAAERLPVSRSMARGLWDQFRYENSVSKRPIWQRVITVAKYHFLGLSVRRRGTSSMPQLVSEHFATKGKRTSAYYSAETPSESRIEPKNDFPS
ncbi:hypothetical protein AVEN_32049-1 [Araneus ventricosus]|uniref:Uncharacterized protein n=1 Tax=Araneus ventricosus TaxID=182803 RepID=A0A4Y2V7T8_ARAVE|nr:hypothetical protein AVEN_32049-1 [Araneus ventricosus]